MGSLGALLDVRNRTVWSSARWNGCEGGDRALLISECGDAFPLVDCQHDVSPELYERLWMHGVPNPPRVGPHGAVSALRVARGSAGLVRPRSGLTAVVRAYDVVQARGVASIAPAGYPRAAAAVRRLNSLGSKEALS